MPELIAAGAVVATAHGVDQALAVLAAWDVFCDHQHETERTATMTGIECAFTGRLAHEPEIKTSKAGKPWASLSVGVGESEALQWVRVAVFGEMAEAIRALPKGAKVYVEGRLKLEEWTGKDGVARHGLNVAATLAQPLGQIGRRRPSKPSGDPVKPTGDPVRDWQRPVAAAGAPSGQRDPLSEPIPF